MKNIKEESKKSTVEQKIYIPKFRKTDDPYNIPPEEWAVISDDTVKSNATFPADFGDNIKAFAVNCHRFKAANWKRWTFSECLVHYFKRLDRHHYEKYVNFVLMCHLMIQYKLTLEELEELYFRVLRFSTYYEESMYRYDYERLGACRPILHQLRHGAEAIRWAGPMFVYWQFPMERFCGMVKFQIKSRTSANVNIANVQRMVEQTNLLPFVLDNVKPFSGSKKSCYDENGCLLLEKLLYAALKKKQKAPLLLAKAATGESWKWDDVFSDASYGRNTDSSGDSITSDEDDGGPAVKPIKPNHLEAFKRVSKFRRLIDRVPNKFIAWKRRISAFQQGLLSYYLSTWYNKRSYIMDEDLVNNMLDTKSVHWKNLMTKAGIWRSMDIKRIVKVGTGQFVARSKRTRVTAADYRRKNAKRSCAFVELMPEENEKGEYVEGVLPVFGEVQIFISIRIPVKKINPSLDDSSRFDNDDGIGAQAGTFIRIGEEDYETFEFHLAVLKEIPVAREGILVEAKMKVKGRKLVVRPCSEIRALVGLIHSRDRKYITWEHGCFDLRFVYEFEKGLEWKEKIIREMNKQQLLDQDDYGISSDLDEPDQYTSECPSPTPRPDMLRPTTNKPSGKQVSSTKQDVDVDGLFDSDDKALFGDSSVWDEAQLEEKNVDGDIRMVEWKTSTDPAMKEKQILEIFGKYYVRHKIKRDGNCGFRVVASALVQLGNTNLYQFVRNAVGDYLEAHQRRYMSEAYRYVRPSFESDIKELLRDTRGQSVGSANWFCKPWHTQLVADCYGVFVAVIPNLVSMRLEIFAPRSDSKDRSDVLEDLSNPDKLIIGIVFIGVNHWEWIDFNWRDGAFRQKLMDGVNANYVQVNWAARPNSTEL